MLALHVIDVMMVVIVNRSTHINQSKERKTKPGARYSTVVRLDLVSSEKSRSLLARSRSKKRPCCYEWQDDALPDSGHSEKHLSSPPATASLARSRLSPSFCHESAASGARAGCARQ